MSDVTKLTEELREMFEWGASNSDIIDFIGKWIPEKDLRAAELVAWQNIHKHYELIEHEHLEPAFRFMFRPLYAFSDSHNDESGQ